MMDQFEEIMTMLVEHYRKISERIDIIERRCEYE